MRLRVAQHLQAVFQATQESVGVQQVGAILFGHLAGGDQRRQRVQQATLAQRRFAATADQLQRLREELDFTDTAGAALDVVVHLAARDLGGDRGLHLAQAIECGEIQIAAVDERTQRLQPRFARRDIPGDGARLQPGIALPVAAFALEVLVHAGERQRDAAGIAERAQAQIDAVAEAIHGGVIQQPRQALAKACEVFLGGERARAIGFAALRVGVDQIHIRTEIEFATTELAQAEHHQLLRAAIGGTHHAVAAGEFLFQRGQRQL